MAEARLGRWKGFAACPAHKRLCSYCGGGPCCPEAAGPRRTVR